MFGVTRVNVFTLSPETTGTYLSQAGGEFGPDLKRAGFDALIITGKAESPIYLIFSTIDDQFQCEFIDAQHLWGKDRVETRDILKAELNFTDKDIGSLYSVYSVAAIFILLLGGVIVDKYGTKKSVLFFGVLCTVAAIVTMSSSKLGVMLTGRVLLGLGAEPLIVAVTTALAKWFKGKELSFAFGINLTIARLGSVAADNSPRWAKAFYSGWQEPLMVAAVISLFCVVGGIVNGL